MPLRKTRLGKKLPVIGEPEAPKGEHMACDCCCREFVTTVVQCAGAERVIWVCPWCGYDNAPMGPREEVKQ
jgi:hypothetical protein